MTNAQVMHIADVYKDAARFLDYVGDNTRKGVPLMRVLIDANPQFPNSGISALKGVLDNRGSCDEAFRLAYCRHRQGLEGFHAACYDSSVRLFIKVGEHYGLSDVTSIEAGRFLNARMASVLMDLSLAYDRAEQEISGRKDTSIGTAILEAGDLLAENAKYYHSFNQYLLGNHDRRGNLPDIDGLADRFENVDGKGNLLWHPGAVNMIHMDFHLLKSAFTQDTIGLAEAFNAVGLMVTYEQMALSSAMAQFPRIFDEQSVSSIAHVEKDGIEEIVNAIRDNRIRLGREAEQATLPETEVTY